MDKQEGPVFELFSAEAATITLRNLQLTASITIDEIVLQGGHLTFVPGKNGAEPIFSCGETSFRAMMTEANVNALLAGNTPSSAPVRNMKVSLLSGRAQFKGQYLKSVMGLPFTLEAKPVLQDGVRVKLDCSASQVGGFGLPAAVVEVIQHALNEKLTIDLSDSKIPVHLDEIRCEPGRLTVIGTARLGWPLAPTAGSLSAANASDPMPKPR